MTDQDAPTYEELCRLVVVQADLIRELEKRIADLEADAAGRGNGPGAVRTVPSFVKSNTKPRAKHARKPRPQGFSRQAETATRIVDHVPDRCPDCNRELSGGWVHRTRQVIDIPPAHYEVVEHRIHARHCGVCGKDHIASSDLSEEVVGKKRFGIRLTSLIVYLRGVCRLPVRSIQALLRATYELNLSTGAIVDLLHSSAHSAIPTFKDLVRGIRSSKHVHCDETSWRENGQSHFMWSFSTKDIRLFLEHKRRSHHVPEKVLGAAYKGVLCSDFYAGYSYYLGEHQRCWVHFLRDLLTLEEKNPDDADLAAWIKKVRKSWADATSFKADRHADRVIARRRFQRELTALAQPFASKAAPTAPQRVLADRIMRFGNELFTFVTHPGVPPDNNAAERAIRPLVIQRKITGGTRSKRGSETVSILASVLATWNLRGLNPVIECRNMLACAKA